MSSESESETNSVYEDEPTEEVTMEERDEIRKELSTMSFEDLQKLKEDIGSKMYNKTLTGEKDQPKQRIFKRVNKNRPREMSSKIRPRIVKHAKQFVDIKKKQFNKDPRFDTRCGEFDKDKFRANYKFVDEIRKTERKQLDNELKDAKDPKRKTQIKMLMQRIDNQLRDNEKLNEKEEKLKMEQEEIKEQRKQGKKPIYKRKSEKKIEELVEKYEELKKTNKLQKHIERRSKKMLNKERKKLSIVKS